MAPKRKAAGAAAPAKGKKTKTAAPAKQEKAESSAAAACGIIIEAWANKLEKLLTSSDSDLKVTINPEKPRKGCFEVRDTESGETFVSLLDMPRPFTKLKALDIEELAETILSKAGTKA